MDGGMLTWVARFLFFFFNDTATTEIYTLSLHDALPISRGLEAAQRRLQPDRAAHPRARLGGSGPARELPHRRGSARADRGGDLRPTARSGVPPAARHRQDDQLRDCLRPPRLRARPPP